MLVSEKISRKEEILQQAAKLFREKGYTAASVRDIAHYLGMEAPSLYFHFKSKEDILQNICFSIARSFTSRLSKAEKLTSDPEKLKMAIQIHVEILLKNQDSATVLWNEWKHLNDEHKTELKQLQDSYEHRFRNIILDGMEDGIFRHQDLNVVTKSLLSMLNGITNWYKEGMCEGSEQLADQIAENFLIGIINQK